VLRASGIFVEPYDLHPGRANEYHGDVQPFTRVLAGGPEQAKASMGSGRKEGGSFALFLCYPPPDSDMAARCLAGYDGGCLVHVGEFRGDTGTGNFEKMLFGEAAGGGGSDGAGGADGWQHWYLEATVSLPNWGNTAYALTVWKRQKVGRIGDKPPSAAAGSGHPLSCSACAAPLNTALRFQQAGGVLRLHRCKFCREEMYCSEACQATRLSEHRDVHSLRLMYMKRTLRLESDFEVILSTSS
jgi:hypothetical protein